VKTILLFDNISHGHHPTYLRLFSKTLLEMGYRVTTLCPDSDELNAWVTQHYPNYAANFQVAQIKQPNVPALPILGYAPRPLNALLQWKYAASSIQNIVTNLGHSPDLVFFPWLDIYLSEYLTYHLVDIIFPYAWSGLFFHPPYLIAGQKRLPILGTPLSPYSVTRSPHCRSIAFLDEFEAATLQQTLDKPVIPFPDLTDESSPDLSYPIAHQIREKAGDRKVIGLLGALSRRKGLLTLLEVAKDLEHDDWFFVFVGELDERGLSPEEIFEIRRFIQSDPANCLFHLNWIPDEPKFNAVVEACNVLFASYENFPYSSNILAKAAVFEKPIIVSDGFCMGRRAETFQLGIKIPAGSSTHCLEALTMLRDQLNSQAFYVKPDFEGYRKRHSIDQLRDAFYTVCSHIN